MLLVSALVSYVYYRRTVAQQPVDLWALVPDDAVLVAATRDHPTLVRHLKETQLWDNLATLRYFQQVEENVALADSLGSTRNSVLSFLGRKNVLTSVHVTGPRSFDVLFLVPVGSVREHRQIRTLVEALGRDARYRLGTRSYHGQELTTITPRQGGGLTYFNYRNTLVISANATLVEAVVRRTEHEGQPSIAAEFGNTDYLRLKDVDAMLLVNYRQLPPFLGVFFQPALRPDFEYLASIGDKSLLQMKLSANRVVFNGFTNPERARGSLHQRLQNQPADRLRMAEVLSTRTALLLHVAANPAALRAALPTDTTARRLVDSLATTLDAEAALCYLAVSSPRAVPARLAVVRTHNAARTALWLGQLRRATGTSPSFELYGAYQLYQNGVPRLAQRLLGPLFAPVGNGGAPATALVGNYLVLADDAAALRVYLTDVAAGRLWTNSPTQVALLEETTPVARLSVVLDTRNSWNVLLRALVEDRRAGLLRNEALLQRFPQIALQFAPADNGQYYTQWVLRHPPVGPAVASLQGNGGVGSSLSFKAGLAGLGPVLLPAPVPSRPPSVLVQDRSGALHYVTPDNTVGWSDTLGGALVSPPALLPGAFGRRPGLLLSTANRVFLLDEQGRSAPNFPLNLPDTVQAESVGGAPAADGQPARVLVADRFANLFLFDARGNAPAGWQPKRLDFALGAPPQLLRVGGRDVVVCLLQNGYIFAYDILGNALPGFPISLGARLHTQAFVEAGPTLRRTRLTVVNQHAELVTFTLSGEVVQRRRLTTWSRSSSFRLVADQDQQSYAVVRDDGQGRTTVLDAAGRILADRRFVTSGEKPVQLFRFGARRALVITEPGPAKAYLFDTQSRLVGGEPFDSSAPTVGLTYDAGANAYQLYRVVGNELRRLVLKMD
ncbi:hypothetical protein B0919_05520 [Hymenobacter sp. CRA2]|nr:hypothetical protein B0919_05520 [Hymenobacter sp. CRA2]